MQELKIKVGADYLPERVEQTAVDEVTTVYLFRNYRSRIALAPDEFDLSVCPPTWRSSKSIRHENFPAAKYVHDTG